jgi:Fe-S-cluster containining protein
MNAIVEIAQAVRDCSCSSCVQACRDNPGWPTPEQAARFIDDGLAMRLMLDWLEPSSGHDVDNDERIYILAPASIGHEGEYAPEMEGGIFALFIGWTKGRCTFLTKESKCEVHDRKPIQCRAALACVHDHAEARKATSNYAVARLWFTDEGRALVARWREIVGLEDGGLI